MFRSHFTNSPDPYPYPLFSRVILPLETELQGVVVEIFPYDLEHASKTHYIIGSRRKNCEYITFIN